MRKNLSRSDGRYKEIEKFKDYELTQCIAYEMAVRNEEIKELAYKRDSTSILNMFDETWIKRMNTISTKEEEDEILDEFTKIAVANIEMYKENQRLRKEIIEKSYFDIANQKGSKINDLLSNVFYKDYVSRETQRIQAKKSHLIDTGSMKYAFTDEGKADTKKAFDIALEDFSDKDFIFVDIAGRSVYEDLSWKEIYNIFKGIPEENFMSLLTLSFNMSEKVALEIYTHLKEFKPHGLILTKADETQKRGIILNAVDEIELPIYYFTNGQKVPHNLLTATPQNLAKLILE